MQVGRLIRYPVWAMQVLGPTKSFARNPILGSPRLNRMGLHRWRIDTAHRMAAWRRRGLARAIGEEAVHEFAAQGYFLRRNFLPPEIWDRLKEEVAALRMPAREMREGSTVTRLLPLGRKQLRALPVTAEIVARPDLNDLVRYAAACGGMPAWFYQTVIAEPGGGGPDPQTELHSDTFFPTAKAWLFLQDVGEEDGPFAYVPGSHRLTPERRDWEYRCSISAVSDPRSNHRGGSLRVGPAELDEMRFPQAVKIAVPANTLVVADTHGFHGRTPSSKRTVRTELHAALRTNPFLPSSLLDAKSWPGIRERQFELLLAYEDFAIRHLGKRRHWHETPPVALDGPPTI